MRNVTFAYEVIMFSETCPSEKSSLGIFQSEESAKSYIEKTRSEYGEDKEFEIETKYYQGLWD